MAGPWSYDIELLLATIASAVTADATGDATTPSITDGIVIAVAESTGDAPSSITVTDVGDETLGPWQYDIKVMYSAPSVTAALAEAIGDAPNDYWELMASGVSESPYTDSTVQENTTYEYKVIDNDGTILTVQVTTGGWEYAAAGEATGDAGTPAILGMVMSITAEATGSAPASISISDSGSYNNTYQVAALAESIADACAPTLIAPVAVNAAASSVADALPAVPGWILSSISCFVAEATGTAGYPLVTSLSSTYVFSDIANAAGIAPDGITFNSISSLAVAVVAESVGDASIPQNEYWWKPELRNSFEPWLMERVVSTVWEDC